MKLIPAALQTALNNNTGTPFFRAYLDADETEVQPTSYEIFNLQANLTFPYDASLVNGLFFYIARGLRVDGIEYPIYSSLYHQIKTVTDMRTYITIEGHIFQDRYIQTTGDVPANTLLSNAFAQTLNAYTSTHHTNQIIYPTPAPWWKTIQFYADGKDLNIRTFALESLLKQKYLVQLCEQDGNDVIAISSSQFEDDPVKNFESNKVLSALRTWRFDRMRQYIWTDETGTQHTDGDPDSPIYNMGYIESTVDPSPAFGINSQSQEMLTIRVSMPQLQLTSGDVVTLDSGSPMQVYVREVFDTDSDPAWYQELTPIIWNETQGTPPPYSRPLPVWWETSKLPRDDHHRNSDQKGYDSLGETPIHASFSGTLGKNHTLAEMLKQLSTGSSGGGGTWGDIAGTLADQTDLQAALNAKAAAVHTHTTRQALLMHANNGTVGPGATLYLVPALQGFVSVNAVAIPFNCTVKNLTVRTNSIQPGSGAMTITLQREVVDTTLTISIGINAAVGTYSNTSTPVTFTAGQRLGIKFVNAASANSATITAVSVELQPSTL